MARGRRGVIHPHHRACHLSFRLYESFRIQRLDKAENQALKIKQRSNPNKSAYFILRIFLFLFCVLRQYAVSTVPV